jgi:lipopolysaccharide/colanic/teichoic acid biosynthesis glycosyltransferase
MNSEKLFETRVYGWTANPFSRSVKRMMDITIAVVGLCFVFPLLGLIALLIKIESQGDALFRQWRIGEGGRKFLLLKFRTMYDQSNQWLDDYFREEPTHRISWEQFQKLRNDPRITRIGKILRRSSMDELPQLWNILVGEMSLVGPRPILLEQREIYGPAYHVYIEMRPGLTGLWQVMGGNRVSFAERTQFDVKYALNWSLTLDLKILLRTILVVIRGDDAF